MSRTLIFGASGFIGKQLNKKISDKMETLSFGSKDLDLISESSVEKIDSLLQKNDSVVFFSAITPGKGRDSNALLKNLKMAHHIGLVLEKKQISQFIYISSDAVHDYSINPIRENSPCFSYDLYGYMHIGRELILSTAAQKSHTAFLTLRPCAVLGPQDPHNSYGPNRFIRSALTQGKITLFGQGEETRDHIDVNDVVQIIQFSLEKKLEGALNLATGQSISFFDLAKKIQELVLEIHKKEVQIECLPRGSTITHRQFDISSLHKALPGFQFTPRENSLKEFICNG